MALVGWVERSDTHQVGRDGYRRCAPQPILRVQLWLLSCSPGFLRRRTVMTTPSLLDVLQSTDMLEINGLHAWEFVLVPHALVAAQAALAAGQDGAAEQLLLQIECMDGR